MAMYLHLNQSQNDLLDQDARSNNNIQEHNIPQSPLNSESQQQQSQSITGKRKCMDKDSSSSSSGKSVGCRTIDPLSLIPDDSKSFSFKRQRLDSVNSADFSIPLTGNDESFTSSYVFLHSTVSRPAASSQSQSNSTPSSSSSYPGAYQPQEEERILREEFFSQMSPQAFHSSSGSFGNLAGYGLPPYPVSVPPVSPSPYMLPSFAPPMMHQAPAPSIPPHYNNGYFSASEMMYGYPPASSREQMMYSNRPSPYPPSSVVSGGINPGLNPEEFIAETKLSKNIKKMTTVLGQIPGLEKIRWQVG